MNKNVLVLLAGLAGVGAAHAAPANLTELKDEKGAVEVRYERATARSAAFAPLLAARDSVPIKVLLVGSADPVAVEVAAAYAQGVKTVLGNVESVDSRSAVPAGAYVAEVGYAVRDYQMQGTATRILEFSDGEKCTAQIGGGVKCQDMVAGPVDKGSTSRMVKANKAEVTIKLRTPAGDTVAEDVFSVASPGDECGNTAAALSTLAGLVGAQALFRRPISNHFHSDLALLGCQRK